MKTKFEQARDEVLLLNYVDNDFFRYNNISDLIYAVQFEIDLYEMGDSEATEKDYKQFKAYIKKWKKHV